MVEIEDQYVPAQGQRAVALAPQAQAALQPPQPALQPPQPALQPPQPALQPPQPALANEEPVPQFGVAVGRRPRQRIRNILLRPRYGERQKQRAVRYLDEGMTCKQAARLISPTCSASIVSRWRQIRNGNIRWLMEQRREFNRNLMLNGLNNNNNSDDDDDNDDDW